MIHQRILLLLLLLLLQNLYSA